MILFDLAVTQYHSMKITFFGCYIVLHFVQKFIFLSEVFQFVRHSWIRILYRRHPCSKLLFVQPHCLYLYRRLVDGDHRITQDNKNLDTFFCLISIFIRRFVNTTKTACQNFAFLSRKKTQKSDKNAPPYTKFFHQINIKCNSNKEDQLWKIPWTSCRSIHRITIFFNPCVHKNTNIPAAKPFLDNVGLENASESKMF